MRFQYGTLSSWSEVGLTLDSDSVVRKTCIVSTESFAKEVGKVVNHFINNPSPLVVPLYDFKYFGKEKDVYKYSYSMMRLGILDHEERSLITSAGENKKDFLEIYKIITSDYPSLIGFLTQVIQDDKYWDLHDGNIMRDMNESYRLIDIEGFITNDPIKNSWFQ